MTSLDCSQVICDSKLRLLNLDLQIQLPQGTDCEAVSWLWFAASGFSFTLLFLFCTAFEGVAWNTATRHDILRNFMSSSS